MSDSCTKLGSETAVGGGPELDRTETIRKIHGDRKVLLVLVLVTGLGGLLRVAELGAKSFWIDELLSICHAQSIDSMRSFLTPSCGNAHPPLYFLLLKVWSGYGTEEFYLRLLSVLPGIAMIPVTYLLGRELLDEWAGMIGATLVAVSPFFLLYDRELRMYSLLTFLTICSLYWFIKALRTGRWTDWFGYTILSVLNVYVHYHAFLVLLFEWGLFFTMYRRCRGLWVKALVSQLVIGLAFAFWVPAFVFQITNPQLFALNAPDKFPVVAWRWPMGVSYLLYAFSLGQTLMPWRAVAIAGALGFGAATIIGVRRLKGHRETLLFMALYLGIPVTAGFMISSSMPRYYVFLAPVYYLVVAWGVLGLEREWLRVIVIALLVVPMGVSAVNYYRNREFHILAHVDPWREVGNYIRSAAHKDDCIVTIGSYRPLAYYTGNFAGFRRPIYGGNFKDSQSCMNGDGGRRIWLVTADPAVRDLGEAARNWLNERYVRVAERKYFRDPYYRVKSKLFKKNFLEYRISVCAYGKT